MHTRNSDLELRLAEAIGRPLPPPIEDPALEATVRAAVTASGQTVVALDDDPTGVQTVHDVAVLADWAPETLAAEFDRAPALFFILTNSRSLDAADAAALNRELGRRLQDAASAAGRGLSIVSRSDSTLRGHYPAETDALAEALGGVDGVLICPAFFEGGRVTVDDTHFLVDGDRVVPVAETEFAQDATFGYRARTLPAWVEEKTGGIVPASAVVSITLEDVRVGGAERVATVLREVAGGLPVIVNVVDYADLWTVVLGILTAEAAGKRFLYRTGASFVRARAGIPARPLLTRAELLADASPVRAPGLVVVGSHVRRSTEQLEQLLTLPGTTPVELRVPRLLAGDAEQAEEIARASSVVNEAIMNGETAVLFTSRQVERPRDRQELDVARIVSGSLVQVVEGLRVKPGWVIGKGGITSSDVGTRGLGAQRAEVLGQVRPGVPVWRLGPESRFPGLSYVVFPGNVGGPETLREIVADLVGAPD
ncbi:MAG: four-carbon acid sugar kinase family protein [Thermomicrobiales bacterium]